MAQPLTIFVNLPVADVAASTALYEAFGGTRNPQFSDAEGTMVEFSDAIRVMLLSRARFATFTPRPVADARAATEVLLCLSAPDRAGVDAVVEKAAAAGATADPCPVQEHGWMYGRSFADFDGHIWEVAWMDVAAATAAMAQCQPAAEPAHA